MIHPRYVFSIFCVCLDLIWYTPLISFIYKSFTICIFYRFTIVVSVLYRCSFQWHKMLKLSSYQRKTFLVQFSSCDLCILYLYSILLLLLMEDFSSLPEHNTVETFINHTFGKLQTRHVCTSQTTSLKFFTGQTTFWKKNNIPP